MYLIMNAAATVGADKGGCTALPVEFSYFAEKSDFFPTFYELKKIMLKKQYRSFQNPTFSQIEFSNPCFKVEMVNKIIYIPKPEHKNEEDKTGLFLYFGL